MKSRRNRKNRKGGGPGFFDMVKSVGAKVSSAVTPAPANVVPKMKYENSEIKPEIEKLNQVFKDIDTYKSHASYDKLPDVMEEVKELGNLSGYSERALINGIVAHNTAFKLRQMDTTLGSECGPKCVERADSIRKALRKLVEYSERSNALGYIGMGRGIANSTSYLANSASSLASKTPGALTNASAMASKTASSLGSSLFNRFTQKTAIPSPAVTSSNTVGGTRRRRRR